MSVLPETSLPGVGPAGAVGHLLVSVIVPAHNNAATVGRTMASLARQTWPALEVLVTDDGSTDGTWQAMQAFAGDPRFRLLALPERRGAAAARNLALRHARGDILAFIDADMEAEPGWIEALTEPLVARRADCSGGPDRVPREDPLVSRCVGYSMDSPLATGGLRWGSTRLVRYLPGTGNLAMTRSTLERVGLLDEWFHDSGEDKEWLFRVRRARHRIEYVPRAQAWHHRTTCVLTHWRKMYRSGLRRVDIWRLMPDSFELPHLMPALLTLLLLAMAALPLLAPPPAAWYWAALAAAAGLLLEGFLGARAVRDLRALVLVPVTSFMVPVGYGAGTLVRLLQVAWGAARGG